MSKRSVSKAQEAYRATGGLGCPVCQSSHVLGKSFDIESGLVTQPCGCDECGAAWTAMYRLAGYVREGEAGAEDWEVFADTEIVEVPEDEYDEPVA